jgi:hypothetical protein
MVTWAKIVTRGEIGPTGDFLAWDETIWQANREQLLANVSDWELTTLGPAIKDFLFWLRGEIALQWELARSPSSVSAGQPPLALYERLIKSEPKWENFIDRGNALYRDHLKYGSNKLDIVLRDCLEVSRLTGVFFDPFIGHESPS